MDNFDSPNRVSNEKERSKLEILLILQKNPDIFLKELLNYLFMIELQLKGLNTNNAAPKICEN